MNTVEQRMKDGKHVAMVYKACPICGCKDDDQSAILLSRRLGDISAMHNQIDGFGKPCKECQKGLDMGGIWIIIIDKEKSGDMKIENWFRTGNMHCVKAEAVERILEGVPDLLANVKKTGLLVMDYKEALEFNLPVDYDPKKPYAHAK